MENWSKIAFKDIADSKKADLKEAYLEEFKTTINFLSEFEPTDPDGELIDFIVFAVN